MKWTAKEKRFLKRFYKNTSNEVIGEALHRSRSAVNHKGIEMGLVKKERNHRLTRNNGDKVSSYYVKHAL